MAENSRKRITANSKKAPTKENKERRLEKRYQEWQHPEYDCYYCQLGFMVAQQERGNAKQTQTFYKQFFNKYEKYLAEFFHETPKNTPIEILTTPSAQAVFMEYLKNQGLGQQTINSYLRAYRAWGNWCEEEGFLDGFKCPIKEVEPPLKVVYTDKELELLMKKPSIDNFTDFRSYCIIALILNTGARSNTILNIKLCDVELEEGYITFNKLKNHGIVRLGLERKVKRDLADWIEFWRYGKGAEPTDYLFCNEYGEQLTRDGLSKTIKKYNERRGVEKSGIHLLRHTFAKKWITSGGDIISLARVLTHSELEMVKRYANLYGEDVKKEIEEHSVISQMRTKSGKTLRNQKNKITD